MPTVSKASVSKVWPRTVLFLTLVALVAAGAWAVMPMTTRAEPAATAQAMSEMSIGSPDAPVVMHEYSSLTCPHCADFHKDTLPAIKKDYVDTGKVRIVFHDFPLGNLALGAMMIVRCAGPERNIDFFNMLYDTQTDWARAENPHAALVTLSRFYGLSADDVDACLGNTELMTAIQAAQQDAVNAYGIDSTPTFIIDGQKIAGGLPYGDFQKVLDKALAAHGK